MKKIIFSIILMSTSFLVSSQKGFYVSLAGGPTYKAGERLLSTSEGAWKGSYGEGIQGQLRTGYFFNEKVGVELGFGYLHGDEQQIRGTRPNRYDYLDVTGKARAIGAALAGIYNISPNVYVKAGVLTKVAGKTLAEGTLETLIPAKVLNPLAPAGTTVPLNVEFEREGTGKMPVGFLAAFGVKYKLASKWFIFAEMEYQGINVTTDKSTIIESGYAATLAGKSVTRTDLIKQANQLLALGALKTIQPGDLLSIADEFVYAENPDPKTQRKTFDVPYSSFGFVLGLSYYFN